jgi:starch synthase
VRRAVRLWRDRERWQALVRQSMSQDFSWDGPARQYLSLYGRVRRA